MPGLMATARGQDEAAAFERAAWVLEVRCSMPGCHTGPEAPKGLRLDRDQIYRSTVNVRARADRRAMRVAPGHPGRSLLYRKLLAPEEGDYPGRRMPLDLEPLSEEEIAQVRWWIESFPADQWGPVEDTAAAAKPRTFHDGLLINLPTPDPLGDRQFRFSVLHRFKPSATDERIDDLYGLDGGAWTSLGLTFGLTRSLELGLRHTNYQKADEVYFKATAVRQDKPGSPVSLALRGGVSHLRETGRVNRTRYTAQIILGRRFGKRLSLMAVPTYASRTHFLDPADDRGTTALGYRRRAQAEASPRPDRGVDRPARRGRGTVRIGLRGPEHRDSPARLPSGAHQHAGHARRSLCSGRGPRLG